jgi:hypothetical protein
MGCSIYIDKSAKGGRRVKKGGEGEGAVPRGEKSMLSRDTKMAMISQFLRFMLDAYDMALVLVMAPIRVKILFAFALWMTFILPRPPRFKKPRRSENCQLECNLDLASGKGSEAWQYITIVLTYSITMAARPVGSCR